MKENKALRFIANELKAGEQVFWAQYDKITQRRRFKNAVVYFAFFALILFGAFYCHGIMKASGNYDKTFIIIMLVLAFGMLIGAVITAFRLTKHTECFAVTDRRIIIKRYYVNPIRLEEKDLVKGGTYSAFSVYYDQIKTDENAARLLSDEEKQSFKNYFTVSYRNDMILVKAKNGMPVDRITGEDTAEAMNLIEGFVREANR